MIKKKTDDVVVSEPVKAEVSEVKVDSAKQNTVEVKEEVKIEEKPKDNNVVSFVKPTVQQPVQQTQYQAQVQRPQVQYNQPAPVQTETIVGALEIMQDGQGFVRPKFIPTNRDAFIGSMQIRRYGLRAGDMILGAAKAPKENEKYWAMTRIDKVNGLDLAEASK